MQCRKLVVIFNSSDCGSKYKKAMEIHTENIANGNTDNDNNIYVLCLIWCVLLTAYPVAQQAIVPRC